MHWTEIKGLIEKLELGKCIEEPVRITGGLLHKMYRVVTVQGAYAVKILNEEIMSRPEALQNTINSEKIAAALQGQLPVVAAMEIDGKQIHKLDGKYYMVFPWMEGKSVFPPEIGVEHCEAMGHVLGKIHSAVISVEGVEPETEETELYTWDSFVQSGTGEELWFRRLKEALPDIKEWNQAACDVREVLAEKVVISHRDLDPKNVMWNDTQPLIIDWEAAGYVNPYQELLEVLNYWADDGKGSLVKEYFEALVSTYKEYMVLADVSWDAVFAGSYAGMLGWLEYNVKRGLGMVTTDAEEMRLGQEQVLGTIQALYDYQEKIQLMKEWLGENG